MVAVLLEVSTGSIARLPSRRASRTAKPPFTGVAVGADFELVEAEGIASQGCRDVGAECRAWFAPFRDADPFEAGLVRGAFGIVSAAV